MTDTEEKKSLNKVILVFFAHKKYSWSFIKLRLNHCCHMDYFNDVLAMFWGLERVSCIAVYAGSKSLESLYFIKNILICVPKMNKGLTGLERHEQLMTEFSFLGELSR